MKEFVVMMLGAGFIFVLGVVGLLDALSRLSEVESAKATLVASSVMTISAFGFAVVYVRHQRKLRRSHQPPK